MKSTKIYTTQKFLCIWYEFLLENNITVELLLKDTLIKNNSFNLSVMWSLQDHGKTNLPITEDNLCIYNSKISWSQSVGYLEISLYIK